MTREPNVPKGSPVDISMIGRGALGRRLIEMVERYEAEQSEERGMKFVAVRTRQQLRRLGAEGTVRANVLGKPSRAFMYFLSVNRAQETYEWICLSYPALRDVHERARKRLDAYGVKGFPGWVKKRTPATRRVYALQPTG